jgi:hypothetical protein
LLRHRLGALNQRADRFVLIDEVANRRHVDAFPRAGADDRNIDRVDDSAQPGLSPAAIGFFRFRFFRFK